MRSTMRVGLVALLLTLAVPAAVAASRPSSAVVAVAAESALVAVAVVPQPALLLTATVAPSVSLVAAVQAVHGVRAIASDSSDATPGASFSRESLEPPMRRSVLSRSRPPSSVPNLRIARELQRSRRSFRLHQRLT